ncbi:uncharacterized protein LOC126668782 [Mercurialis annua]|uniref:uncharacterized protein LOC126668782 n=1 Tax=Mercurialis annua TaxID=3986 RepID=UPI00215F7085|nr:uncharacterized protein LOC126668782 [Mercurialis annua]
MHRYILSQLSPPSPPPDQPLWIPNHNHVTQFDILILICVLIYFIAITIFCLWTLRLSNTHYLYDDEDDDEPEYVHLDIENVHRDARINARIDAQIDAAERRNTEERRSRRTIEILKLFKKVVYSKNKVDDGDDECPICLEKFEDENKCVVLPCSHMFHELCLQNWLNKNISCPICRADAWKFGFENQV